MTLNFGPRHGVTFVVTTWDPPRTFASAGPGLGPGSPPIADEWTVEARAGGVCVVRVVHSLFASTDDWDGQLDRDRIRLARLLPHPADLSHALPRPALRDDAVDCARPGTVAEVWGTLTTALGLNGARVGDRWTAPAGVPVMGGVVEHMSERPCNGLVRLDTPGPGVAALGAVNFGGSMATLSFYLYGDQATGIVARETPLWDAWVQQRFPAPPEQSKGE